MARRVLTMVTSVLVAFVGVVAAAPLAPAAAASGAAASGTLATSVTMGERHACALTAAGGVTCWGYNYYGQLGDGTTRLRTRPVDVVGLTSGVRQVSAGRDTTCAVTTAGGVKCWGHGWRGQLGNGRTADSSTPVDVVGLSSGVASVSVGYHNVCVVTTAGAAKCWGNRYTLGDGRPVTTRSAVPVDVLGLGSGVRAVVTGKEFSCALTTTGVSCWGQDSFGQRGMGDVGWPYPFTTPVPVLGLGADVTSLSAGLHTVCATTVTGQVWCWGQSFRHLLGVDSTDHVVDRPMLVTAASGVSAMATGTFARCAIIAQHLSCWGFNVYGVLGDGTTTDRATPTPVVGLPGAVTGVATGWDSTCAVNDTGRVYCWGSNASGQLGNGTTTDSMRPVAVRL